MLSLRVKECQFWCFGSLMLLNLLQGKRKSILSRLQWTIDSVSVKKHVTCCQMATD